MFIAHLPAGYILTKRIQKTLNTKKFLWVGLFASVLPDFDILYFYFIDEKQHSHHSYWIHIPFYWILILSAVFIILLITKQRKIMHISILLFTNIFLHLVLDTVVGEIHWGYPFSATSFSFFHVPAIHSFWVYNFLFHWSFLFEIGIIISFLGFLGCKLKLSNTSY